MKIVLVSNYLPDRQASMLRYAGMLERELRKRGHQVTVIAPPTVILRAFGTGTSLEKWLAYVDKYVFAPGYLRRYLRARAAEIDIVHICDHSNAMYLGLAASIPSVITCHDLIAVAAARGSYPGVAISRTGRMLQRWISSSLLRARFVICVSRKTQDDLLALGYGGGHEESSVVHNPLNWDFHRVSPIETEAVLRARGLSHAGEYLLHIGNNSWYKNREGAVKIFAQLKRSARFAHTKLLLAGRPWDAGLREVIEASGVASAIFEMNEVSDEEVRALYSGAMALLFPSRHEGFGWPILEAQACGCPVITTDRAPMTEVTGGAAILVDPEDHQAAADTILAQLGRLASLPAEGYRNVALFSMDRAIEGYLEAYVRVVKQQRAPSASSSGLVR
jgi:glycosyltransferase involved in cell wall biosynthesis